MAIRSGQILLTYEDYLELPNDRNRYEILEGDLAVNPAPNTAHQTVVLNLGALLRDHVRRHDLGRVFIAPTDVLLSDTTIVQPDILFISRERETILRREHVRGAPDLMIEVISPTSARTDRHTKQRIYARYGVPHYWLVDPEQRSIEAYTVVGTGYSQVSLASGNESFSAPPFPDLAIRLDEIWE